MSLTMDKVAQALAESAQVLRAVTAERDELRDKVASFEREKQAQKLAHAIHERGLSNEPIETLTRSLEKMAEQGKLGEVERGLEYFAPTQKLGSISDEQAATLGGSTELERYLSSLVG